MVGHVDAGGERLAAGLEGHEPDLGIFSRAFELVGEPDQIRGRQHVERRPIEDQPSAGAVVLGGNAG